MAEIKSAVEIAMERTKGLRLSPVEKEKLKEEEFQSRARALVNRFLEVDLPFREAEKELGKYEPDERARLEKLMVRALAEALDLDHDNEAAFQGIETLAPEKRETVPRLRDLARAYRRKKDEILEESAEILRKKWAARGLSGSALLPKAGDSADFAGALKEVRPSFETRFEALKKEILEA
jgi:hypothetical protein